MHIPTLLRKSAFSLSGKIALSDPIRNFAYQWAWSHLRNLGAGARVCDIGSRDSLFPVFLAWRGFNVCTVEKDCRFTSRQAQIGKRWYVNIDIKTMDFLTLPSSDAYNAVLSLFSLQHAGDDDVPAYRKAAQLLLPGGIMLSVCEYDPCKTGWQNGRDDGPLRTYGPRDTEERIEQPLLEGGMEIVENKFAGLSGRGNAMSWCDAVEQNTCRVCAIPGFFFLCGRKK